MPFHGTTNAMPKGQVKQSGLTRENALFEIASIDSHKGRHEQHHVPEKSRHARRPKQLLKVSKANVPSFQSQGIKCLQNVQRHGRFSNAQHLGIPG